MRVTDKAFHQLNALIWSHRNSSIRWIDSSVDDSLLSLNIFYLPPWHGVLQFLQQPVVPSVTFCVKGTTRNYPMLSSFQKWTYGVVPVALEKLKCRNIDSSPASLVVVVFHRFDDAAPRPYPSAYFRSFSCCLVPMSAIESTQRFLVHVPGLLLRRLLRRLSI